MPYDSHAHGAKANRATIDAAMYADEAQTLRDLTQIAALSPDDRAEISAQATTWIQELRSEKQPGLMEVFLAEYGLSTDEGVALMCLAEALLRVPDAESIDALIKDKIATSDWGAHLGASTSPLVNASTWALMLTGKVLEPADQSLIGHLQTAVRRLGEPVIRVAVARAMKEMGRQFVLGETIDGAMARGRALEAKGYTHSYDMLGEAARTAADAETYFNAYQDAIAAIGQNAQGSDIAERPGISVKLSALHPRYEEAQAERILDTLYPRLKTLCDAAAAQNIGLNIDAEEADRLALSLDMIKRLLREPSLAHWAGLGVVVQAYGPRASHVIDWLYAAAGSRRIMIRLVKGAYWDSEIKRAQVEGLERFPVFTHKAATDVSYIACARKLLDMRDRIYPQFATHNAHSVAAILHMAGKQADGFEFQRLHGMGAALHDIVKTHAHTRCRIYAPVGAHRDLLAYLVRRLLENGANSSFVNQIVDEDVPAEVIARDPWHLLDRPSTLTAGTDLFAPERRNSAGMDLSHRPTRAALEAARAPYRHTVWGIEGTPSISPFDGTHVGYVTEASAADVETAISRAQLWGGPVNERRKVLEKAADLFEAHSADLFALLAREAGKTLPDALAELREAVDFLRYYASQAPQQTGAAVGRFACISPWNFPLAIFTGQIAAALATGNAVLAKPAPQTLLIAERAVALLHDAGVPTESLQLLPGGVAVGKALTSNPEIDGVVFTGSTQTAKAIQTTMAENLAPGAPLIAETGGLNAMIVDSTALLEQAVQSIIESAFQSAGQRCSALRCLYVQEDIADALIDMLTGAMAELRLGDPWDFATDIGPVIDETSRGKLTAHIDVARKEGRVLFQGSVPKTGLFVPPTLISVNGIEDLKQEVFGPVLHVARFGSKDLDDVIAAINATGYGLTFGLHTRIDDRVQHVTEAVRAGNLYVNRNQIGAIVGSQPFGGEGLSGTGPKAGGPHYLQRFTRRPAPKSGAWSATVDASHIQAALQAALPGPCQAPESCPGPTGESNMLQRMARKPVLCVGPGYDCAQAQKAAIDALGGVGICAERAVSPEALTTLKSLSGVIWWGDPVTARRYAQALALRAGPILPLITSMPDMGHACLERHICVDTTASGGNAALLAGQD